MNEGVWRWNATTLSVNLSGSEFIYLPEDFGLVCQLVTYLSQVLRVYRIMSRQKIRRNVIMETNTRSR